MPISDYNPSAASNTVLGTIPVGPNMKRADVNNAFQQLMADIAPVGDFVDTFVPSPRDFGVVADGTTNDAAAWQRWVSYCEANDLPILVREKLTSAINDKITIRGSVEALPSFGSRNLPIDLSLVTFTYTGTRTQPVVEIGTPPNGTLGANQFSYAEIRLPSVSANGAVTWSSSSRNGLRSQDIGIIIYRTFHSNIYENLTFGFTRGIVYSGVAYCKIFGSNIIDCKYSRDFTSSGTDQNDSFTNENIVIGGKLGHTSNTTGLGFAAMQVFSWDGTASYRGQNNNRFKGVTFESQGSDAGGDRIAVLFDGAGSGNVFEQSRLEGNWGVVGIFDADQAISGTSQNSNFANNNTFDALYASDTGQSLRLVQVGGACGNRLTGAGCQTTTWHSGNLASHIKSRGGLDGSSLPQASITHPDVSIATASPPILSSWRRYTVFGNEVRAHRYAAVLNSGSFARLGVAVKCDQIKDFDFAYAAVTGFPGRPFFVAYNSSGTLLQAGATETLTNPLTSSAYRNEHYVKACTSLGSAQSLTGPSGEYITASDSDGFRSLRVTVRPEVDFVVMGIAGGTNPAAVISMSVTGYATGNKPGSSYPTTDGICALPIYPLMPDGALWQANADPDAGNVGYATLGEVAWNFNAASGQPMGWICNSPGYRAPAWVASTSYAIVGLIVANGGNTYELVTAGTSASSGGPAGTGSSISDGSCVWRYLGTVHSFIALPNIP